MPATIKVKHQETTPSATPPMSYDLEILEAEITTETLIRRSVQEHLRKLVREGFFELEKQQETTFKLHLTQTEIDELATQGKIALENPSDENTGNDIDPESPRFIQKAEDKAISAFKKGALSIFMNGRQIQELHQRLSFEDQTNVIFLRLVPLVGG